MLFFWGFFYAVLGANPLKQELDLLLSYRGPGVKILLFNTTGERDSSALLSLLLVSGTETTVLLKQSKPTWVYCI